MNMQCIDDEGPFSLSGDKGVIAFIRNLRIVAIVAVVTCVALNAAFGASQEINAWSHQVAITRNHAKVSAKLPGLTGSLEAFIIAQLTHKPALNTGLRRQTPTEPRGLAG